jgi:hypothetical protein
MVVWLQLARFSTLALARSTISALPRRRHSASNWSIRQAWLFGVFAASQR